MPTVASLFTTGQLDQAIEQLGVELRSTPDDAQRRRFLFELLSLAGQYERAGRQLDVLARESASVAAAIMPYRHALEAERVREHMFDSGDFPSAPADPAVRGTLNGEPFTSLADADPRIGARLEVFAGGRYLWIPFAHLASLAIEPPAQLRDTHWARARVATGPAIRDLDLGEVLLPVLSPAAWRLTDPELRLGRAVDWDELPDGDFAPIGQKVLRVDDRLVPLLDVRQLILDGA
jgi:type VI secretion system protein ImpE